ncbi:MAG: hypothetical protein JOZ44_04770 [Acidobacteria bacterium]|nr:hypothetical protein [Acidobacteriota bacterium]
MRATLAALLFSCVSFFAFGQQLVGPNGDDSVSLDYVRSLKLTGDRGASNALGGGVLGRQSSGGLLGIDSVANWSSYFYEPGVIDQFGDLQFSWQYTMVGHAPFGHGDSDDWEGESTFIGAPIIPVNVDLRNADGSPRTVNGQRLYFDATHLVKPVLQSPIFSPHPYTSSRWPTQFNDAVQRAEFFNKSDDDWHTVLVPRVATPRTMVLIKGTYLRVLDSNGLTVGVLVDPGVFASKLFPPNFNGNDTTSIIGQAETSHDITTHDISTFLFPNTFLIAGGNFFIVGYHTYDLEAGGADNGWRERRYVLNYSSWVDDGFFGPAFTDVTALSHELTETFNDPFVNNAVPWWLSPNGNCQNNLENGDVIEGLPNATIPITTHGFTYHPQNEALLQWFANQTPSAAINHAYSYPDTSVLTSGAAPQLPGCPAPSTTASTK